MPMRSPTHRCCSAASVRLPGCGSVSSSATDVDLAGRTGAAAVRGANARSWSPTVMTGGVVTLAAPHRGGADGVTTNCEPAHTSRSRWGAWLVRGCHHWKRGHYDAPSYRTGIIDWHRLERRHPGKCHHQLPEIRGLSGLPSELVALRRLGDHGLPVGVVALRAFSSTWLVGRQSGKLGAQQQRNARSPS
jgi:hypothetical protein